MRRRGNILIPVVVVATMTVAIVIVLPVEILADSPDTHEQRIGLLENELPLNKAKAEYSGHFWQDTLKPKTKAASQDFRIEEGEEFATLRDEVFFTTSGVEELVPDSMQTTFNVGQKVYVFAALRAPKEERVRLTWYTREGKEILPSAYFDVEPNVGAVGFRIFSYRTFRRPGDYKVAVFNSAGKEIGETSFTVE